MFNELTRLWSPGALLNSGRCGSYGNDKGARTRHRTPHARRRAK